MKSGASMSLESQSRGHSNQDFSKSASARASAFSRFKSFFKRKATDIPQQSALAELPSQKSVPEDLSYLDEPQLEERMRKDRQGTLKELAILQQGWEFARTAHDKQECSDVCCEEKLDQEGRDGSIRWQRERNFSPYEGPGESTPVDHYMRQVYFYTNQVANVSEEHKKAKAISRIFEMGHDSIQEGRRAMMQELQQEADADGNADWDSHNEKWHYITQTLFRDDNSRSFEAEKVIMEPYYERERQAKSVRG